MNDFAKVNGVYEKVSLQWTGCEVVLFLTIPVLRMLRDPPPGLCTLQAGAICSRGYPTAARCWSRDRVHCCDQGLMSAGAFVSTANETFVINYDIRLLSVLVSLSSCLDSSTPLTEQSDASSEHLD